MLAAGLALLCACSGALLVALCWPRDSAYGENRLLQGSLSLGFGLGLFSIIFMLGRASSRSLLAIDSAVFALLLVSCLYRSHLAPGVSPIPRSKEKTDPGWLLLVLRAGFAIALLAALYSAVLRTIAHPHGDGWDAFAIWNLHARFLFRGGAHWRDGFTAVIPWSHPDYPLLLPAAVAHFWTGLGRESQLVPALIGLVFTFSTAALLYSSLAMLHGQVSALLGGLTLLATPFFIEQGTAQYADVPLSFFILATIALICIYESRTERPRGLAILAGISCGFVSWTKNEGLLFLLAMVTSRLLVLAIAQSESRAKTAPPQHDLTHTSSRESPLSFALFLAGMVPLVLIVVWFKRSVAVPNELFSSVALPRFLDLSRYGAILRWYGKDFLRFGDWLLIPGTVLLAALYLAGPGKHVPAANPGFRPSRIALALTLAGYFAIYLITPYGLYWHLRFSLDRLFLQLWPAVIFLFFLRIPSTTVALLTANPSQDEPILGK